jgi:hypothetical protein
MVGFVPKSLPPQKTTLSLGMEWCFSINQVLADSFSLKDHLTGFYLIMNVLKGTVQRDFHSVFLY